MTSTSMENTIRTKDWVLSVLIIFLAVACQSKKDNIVVHKPDIYMSGYMNFPGGLGNSAGYWKNGTPIKLDSGQNAIDIAVVGSDVYVAGNAGYNLPGGGSSTEAVYWKNGVLRRLGNAPSQANSIVVSGSDVYVAGIAMINGNYVAAYWKNGAIVSLGNSPYSTANAIAVTNDGNIYVVGTAGNYGTLAAYWKNGTLHLLENSTHSFAKSILIYNNDVYIAGTIDVTTITRGAVYWKNDARHSLYLPTPADSTITTTDATGIAFIGNDMNVAGYVDNHFAVCWKNGKMTFLNNPANYMNTTGNRNAILASDSSIYISFNTADYWKDGSVVHVGNGYATSITVVK
ncbi:hypothetical protein [Pinibacter soli]|uniref:Uncharacterized protein n=1 Tax=Pinibacter soli TaxID=3044211 RepID=A0ABT6RFJ8_9BACT|nr:hypothetical protein [Pinibacter soli]MDI3321298.1 hypothetical protein [Pinibacter soli]